MTDGVDPSVHRRVLGVELRKGREAAGLTQRDAAKELDWSLSKLIRIESGAQGVSVNDLRAALALYQVTDPELAAALTSAARGSRGQSWWSNYRDIVSPQFAMLLGFEEQAVSRRISNAFIIPGLLHTREYATALHSVYRDRARVSQVVDLRMERQRRLLAESRAEVSFAFGEEALYRWVGGPGVMRRQLERVLEIGQHPNVVIQIVPVTAGAHPGEQSPFILLRLRETDQELAFLEGIGGDQLIRDDPEQISEYLEYYETITELALPQDEGNSVLREHIDRLSHAEGSKAGRAAG